MDRLLIVNQHDTTIVLDIAYAKSVAAATMRRGRVIPTTVTIPVNGAVNLCEVLNVSKAEALQIVESSPNIDRMWHRGNMIRVVDPDIADAARAARKAASLVETMAATPPTTQEHVFQARIAPVLPSAAAHVPTAAHGSDAPTSPGMTTAFDDGTTQEIAPTGALDPNLRQVASDAIPSTRWERERLIDYARTRGLEIPDDMSKNAVLRKLRGVSA